MRAFVLAISLLGALLSACNSRVSIEDITTAPVVAEADKQFAGVFSVLDGTWQGKFYIYKDSLGQREGAARPTDFTNVTFDSLPLRLMQAIEVTQEYVSESPYFQRVRIRDIYTDSDGEKREVKSRGVNKVQEGRLWCVVVKPGETVVHSGNADGEHTIIWQRNLRDPLKIEYFRETVRVDRYQVWGWGYYGDDNPNLSPRTWFYGDYRRVD